MSALKLNSEIENEWYQMVGEERIGPFSYEQMLERRQNLQLFSADLIWTKGMKDWTPVCDLPEFSSDRILRVLEMAPDQKNLAVFKNRAHPRFKTQISCFVHDQNGFWNGEIQTLSQGGARLIVENPRLHLMNALTVHLRTDSQLSGFNAPALIVNKQVLKAKVQHNTKVFYDLRFENPNSKIQNMIEQRLTKEIRK